MNALQIEVQYHIQYHVLMHYSIGFSKIKTTMFKVTADGVPQSDNTVLTRHVIFHIFVKELFYCSVIFIVVLFI